MSREDEYIGKNIYDVFRTGDVGSRDNQIPESLRPIEDILTGKTMEGVQEHCIDDKWYRTRFVPV